MRDNKTVSAVEMRLLVAILGDYADGAFDMKPPPSAAECARAYQVRPPAPPLPAVFWLGVLKLNNCTAVLALSALARMHGRSAAVHICWHWLL